MGSSRKKLDTAALEDRDKPYACDSESCWLRVEHVNTARSRRSPQVFIAVMFILARVLIIYHILIHPLLFLFMCSIFSLFFVRLLISDIYNASRSVFLPLWCHTLIYRYFHVQGEKNVFLFFGVVRLLDVFCFVFSSFVEPFHFELQCSVGHCRLTWLILCRSLSLCLCFLFSFSSLLSFRHSQTKAYFKTFWKRYTSLHSFSLQSAVSFVFAACFYFLSVTK